MARAISAATSLTCGLALVVAGAVPCVKVGTYNVTDSRHEMEGGEMLCAHPTGSGGSFPLLSFEHGDQGGGDRLHVVYASFMRTMASSGLVICAPLLCPNSCREQQHVHQLNALTAAKALGLRRVLPIRTQGPVGVVGHSTGGMTTLKCAHREAVMQHGIGAAVDYNGDGGKGIERDNVSFEDIEPTLPILLVTGNRDIVEPRGSTKFNFDKILAANPIQPALVGMLNGEGHFDANDITFLHPAPLIAAPYIVAFFAYTLTPSDVCGYEDVLGRQMRIASPSYYDNHLFKSASSSGVELHV